jgi:hypothetical protein
MNCCTKARMGLVDQPLAFGRDSAEDEGGLAGARHAGENGDLALGDIERDVLEVVLAGDADLDRAVHRFLSTRRQF